MQHASPLYQRESHILAEKRKKLAELKLRKEILELQQKIEVTKQLQPKANPIAETASVSATKTAFHQNRASASGIFKPTITSYAKRSVAWNNTTGTHNDAFGRNALTANTTGSYNIGIGNFVFVLDFVDDVVVNFNVFMNWLLYHNG